MNVFIIDLAKCNGCHNCQIACKDEHCRADWPPYAKAQPDTGQFWARVDEQVRGSVPFVRITYTPTLCNHCEQAPCLAAAKDGAVYRRSDGLIIIDPEKAVGQQALVDACPLGAIYWNEELSLPQKCTGCAHLLDAGWEVPRCVDACATDALRYGPEEDFAAEIAEATVREELKDYGSRVYYLHMPKRFCAGTLVDFEADEVVVGARVELIDERGAVVAAQLTDDMGDFFFADVEPGRYAMHATKQGYHPTDEKADVTQRDICFGDLALRSLAA